jgi:hypothetical protein
MLSQFRLRKTAMRGTKPRFRDEGNGSSSVRWRYNEGTATYFTPRDMSERQ